MGFRLLFRNFAELFKPKFISPLKFVIFSSSLHISSTFALRLITKNVWRKLLDLSWNKMNRSGPREVFSSLIPLSGDWGSSKYAYSLPKQKQQLKNSFVFINISNHCHSNLNWETNTFPISQILSERRKAHRKYRRLLVYARANPDTGWTMSGYCPRLRSMEAISRSSIHQSLSTPASQLAMARCRASTLNDPKRTLVTFIF